MKNYLFKYRYKHFEELMQKEFKLEKNLSVECFNNAVIDASEFIFKNNSMPVHQGGVISKDKIYIPLSAFYRWVLPGCNDEFELKNYNDKGVDYIDKEVIYGGYIYEHWGHFLIEMTARLWYFLQNDCKGKGIKIAFSARRDFVLKDNFKEFFKLLGINEYDLIFVKDKTRFKKIIVPEVSAIIDHYVTKEWMLSFKILSEKIKPSKEKKNIFFSRKYFKKNGITLGEEKIAQCFKHNGFEIMYPEKLSLYEMIALLKNAKCIAGLTGTLTHNSIFAGPDTKIASINREEYLNPTQEMIRQTFNQKTTYIDAFYNFLPVHPGRGPYCVGVNKNLQNYLLGNDMKVLNYQPKIKTQQIEMFLKEWVKEYHKSGDNYILDRKLSSFINLMSAQFSDYDV